MCVFISIPATQPRSIRKTRASSSLSKYPPPSESNLHGAIYQWIVPQMLNRKWFSTIHNVPIFTIFMWLQLHYIIMCTYILYIYYSISIYIYQVLKGASGAWVKPLEDFSDTSRPQLNKNKEQPTKKYISLHGVQLIKPRCIASPVSLRIIW